jgi:hypothetical protein
LQFQVAPSILLWLSWIVWLPMFEQSRFGVHLNVTECLSESRGAALALIRPPHNRFSSTHWSHRASSFESSACSIR